MHMSSTMLRRCLGFWLGQGVLKQESQDVYVVLEKNRGGQDLQGKRGVIVEGATLTQSVGVRDIALRFKQYVVHHLGYSYLSSDLRIVTTGENYFDWSFSR